MSNLTIGLDVGDKFSALYIVDDRGEWVETGRVRTTPVALQGRFAGMPRARVVLEAGTHSPWVSRVLTGLGHETIVANPRKLRAIYDNEDKADEVDAEYLARVGRADPTLLRGIRHRGERAQADLAVVRARDALVRTRTLLINHARGVVKAMGGGSRRARPRRLRARSPRTCRRPSSRRWARCSSTWRGSRSRSGRMTGRSSSCVRRRIRRRHC
jgi:transposase